MLWAIEVAQRYCWLLHFALQRYYFLMSSAKKSENFALIGAKRCKKENKCISLQAKMDCVGA